MLSFIVSMRARALSASWEYHCWLLGCTLDSILAQTHPSFEVVVVCHDRPLTAQLDSPLVHVLPVAFAPPARTNDAMCADKVQKLALGIEWAASRGSEYVMFVDADDLVSRRLAGFVAAQNSDGWYFEHGYVHQSGSRWLRRHAPHYRMCGTGLIVRTTAVRIADVNDEPRLMDDLDHTQIVDRLERQGCRLQPLPFPGAIYVLHPDATSAVPGGAGFFRAGDAPAAHSAWRTLSTIKQAAAGLPAWRPITPERREEFTIPHHAWRLS